MTSRDEWNEHQKKAFGDLKREIDPGPGFDQRLWQQLRQSGTLKASASPAAKRRRLLQVAAAVTLFALGLALGFWLQPAGQPQPSGQRYLLLLLAGDEIPSAPLGQLVSEYGQWAVDLRQEGRPVSGARLAPEGVSLPAGQFVAGGSKLQGFFIFSASSQEAALATARTHPHLNYGGRIALHRVLGSN